MKANTLPVLLLLVGLLSLFPFGEGAAGTLETTVLRRLFEPEK